MASNFAKYYKEEEGYDCIENDHGFCAYRIDADSCFIAHVYIDEKSRKKGEAGKLLDQIENMCKEMDVKTIIGNLFINPFNCEKYTRKLMLMFFNGFEVLEINKDCVTIIKEI